PCLNEAESIEFCLKKIKKIFDTSKFSFREVIVVDNGSTDESIKIAKKYKARIVFEKKKGYGNALKKGIQMSKGEFVCFADADDSYNFLELKKFIDKAGKGYDLIQGCRFSKYGGKILPNAMPLTHQYFGNPFLSYLTKLFFKIKFNDVYCGFRMFKKKLYNRNFYFSNGMEFAVENLIKLSQESKNSIEIPITLHKDKRKKNISHLKTFSDGFKTLKFILTCGSQFPIIFSVLVTFFLLIKKLFFIDEISDFKDLMLLLFILTQLIFFYLYSNLVSEYLGFKKGNFVNKVYNFINFNKAFIISLVIIFSFLTLLILYNFQILNFDNQLINFIKFSLLFFVQIFVNILLVSVLEFFKYSKIS
ncbi:glycosyltransferase family 2 protein, partial [Candidatus Pelagibacter sp.]|nr:glycosyltransferase family 2 protein [Candidatus Pelagibacter sp.]